ncbi:hypothetical protein IWW57_006858, partial [Coemansia sp. S610]
GARKHQRHRQPRDSRRDRRHLRVRARRAAGGAGEHVRVPARGAGVPLAGVRRVPVHVVQDRLRRGPARAGGDVRVADAGERGAAAPGDGDRGGVRGAARAGAGRGAAVVRHVRGGGRLGGPVAGGGAGGVHGGGVRAAQPGAQRAPVPAAARHGAAVPRRRQPARAELRGAARRRRRGVCAAQGARRPAHAGPPHGQGRPVAGAGAHGREGAGRLCQRRPGRGARGDDGVVPARVPARQRRRRGGVRRAVDPRHRLPGVPHGVRVQPQEAGGGDHRAPGVDQRARHGAVGRAAGLPRAADGAHPRGRRHAVRARAGHRRARAALRGAVQHKVQAHPPQHQALPPAPDGRGRR